MKKLVALSILTLCLAALPLSASTFVALSESELVGTSKLIVRGEITTVDSHWTESGRLIVSDVVVEVSKTYFGNAPAEITVRTAGGQVGAIRVEAHGFPTFEKGREVILFLESATDGTYSVVGYQQGHYRVVERLDGVTLSVPQVEDGVRYLRPDGSAAAVQQSVEIGVFERALKQHLAKRPVQLQ